MTSNNHMSYLVLYKYKEFPAMAHRATYTMLERGVWLS